MQWAIDQARHSGAEVLAVHAVHQPVPASWSPEARQDILETAKAQAKESLDKWTALLRESDVANRAVVVEGLPAEALLELATDEDAGMIVVGRRGLGGFARLLLGSVSYRLIQVAPIPVVVIPTVQET